VNQAVNPQISLPFSFWLKTGFIFVLWGVTFMPVYPALWDNWVNDSNNSHGMLVPLISAFFVWSNRAQLSKATLSNSNWGAVILGLSLSLYLLALAGHVTMVQQTMIVSSLGGLVLFNFGISVFNVLAFPLLYLIFMIPVPISVYGLAAFPLQLFTTDISHDIIQALGIPVFQEGNMLYFVQAQLEVAEACSGLRSMTAFIMLSVLFAYLMDKGWGRRFILLLSAIPLAIVANILRVTGTGILAHFYGEKIARGFLHDFSGLSVFFFGFILLHFEFMLLNRISDRKE
jgi:exosortase